MSNFPMIDFLGAAKRLIAEWAAMDEDERDQTPSFACAGYGPLPFTVNDDFSVILGNYTDGLVGGGNDKNAHALADQLQATAAMLDYDHSEMTTPLKIG